MIRRHWKSFLTWTALIAFVAVAWKLNVKKEVIAAGAVLWGLITPIFSAAAALLLAWIGAVPLVGPLIVSVLTWPFFLILNGLAFFVSLVGLNVGQGRKVFEARVAAVILVVGILIGFILGKLF